MASDLHQLPRTIWQRVETHIGLWWCQFAGLAAAVIAAACFTGSIAFGYRATVILASALIAAYAVWMEWRLLGRLSRWRTARGGRVYPMAVAVALNWPIDPAWLRPLHAVWWGLHFAASCAAAYAVLRYAGQMGVALDGATRIVAWAVAALLSLGAAYAGNLFLLLAVTSVKPDPERARAIWRRRGWIDVAASVIVLLIALVLRA